MTYKKQSLIESQEPNIMPEWIQDVWGWIVLVAGVISGVIGWCLSQWKNKVEINRLKEETKKLIQEVEKLKAEEAKTQQEIIEKSRVNIEAVQKARSEYEQCVLKCNSITSKIINCIMSDAASSEINSVREEYRSTIFDYAIPGLLRYYEIQAVQLRHNIDACVDFFEMVVLAELERITHWVSILNDPVLLSNLKRSPMFIHNASLNSFRTAIRISLTSSILEKFEKTVKDLTQMA